MEFDRSSLMLLAEQFEKKAEEFLEVADRIRNAASLFSRKENGTDSGIDLQVEQSVSSNGQIMVTELEKAVLQSLSNKVAGREISSMVSYCQHNIGVGTTNSIRTLCYRLLDRGMLERIGRGRYRLTEQGRAIVSEVINVETGQANSAEGTV